MNSIYWEIFKVFLSVAVPSASMFVLSKTILKKYFAVQHEKNESAKKEIVDLKIRVTKLEEFKENATKEYEKEVLDINMALINLKDMMMRSEKRHEEAYTIIDNMNANFNKLVEMTFNKQPK
jgi:hypothetical protein